LAYTLLKKICVKELQILTVVFILWSVVELLASIVLTVRFMLNADYFAGSIVILFMLLNLTIQVISGRKMYSIVKLDQEFQMNRGKYSIFQFYYKTTLFWNFKLFLMHLSCFAKNESIYGFRFRRPFEVFQVLTFYLTLYCCFLALPILTIIVFLATSFVYKEPNILFNAIFIQDIVYFSSLLAFGVYLVVKLKR